MAQLSDLVRFLSAYNNADIYPLNLTLRGSNNGALQTHRDLLVENSQKLFRDHNDIAIIELDKDGKQVLQTRKW
jgi:hypothetical protein